MTRPNPARRTAEDDSLSIYPHQVHIGDRFTDADTDGAAEWEVASRPAGHVQEGPPGPRTRPAARESRDGQGEVLGGPRKDPGAPKHSAEPRRGDRRRGRRGGDSEPRAPAAARSDSAPRGGKAGPRAAPGLRRARAGEGAGENPARDVDVVDPSWTRYPGAHQRKAPVLLRAVWRSRRSP